MTALANLLIKKPFAWAIVVVVLLLGVASSMTAVRVQQDDDLLAFLPKDNPEVGFFYDVNKRFGGLDVALVGIASPDAFVPDFLSRLVKVTKRLNETPGVDYALSLTNMEDFVQDAQKGGISLDYLVRKVPEGPEQAAALRERVMSLDHVVGNVVSKDGKSVVIYCFGTYGTDPKLLAGRVRDVVNEAFPAEAKYWGGNPFIATYIFGVTQEDMRRLSPWAVLVIVIITVVSFRDPIGVGLALLSTVLSISYALGLMGALGVHANIVLGSMPVILFALGSAFSVHVISRYYIFARDLDCEAAIVQTLQKKGPPVLASGFITMTGLLSFVVMDIGPMRTFGIFTALGLFAVTVLALVFVPAVLVLTQLKGRVPGGGLTRELIVKLCRFAAERRVPVMVVIVLLLAAGAVFGLRVETRMDTAAFFSKGSPPDEAETFLKDHFGGSQFLQVHVAGDMTDPHVLRETQRIADKISLLPHVTSVNQIGMILSQLNDAMTGDRRLADSTAKIKLLYGFLAGKRAVSQFVTEDRKEALMQIKVSSNRAEEVRALLASVKELVQKEAIANYEVAATDGLRKDEALQRQRATVLARIDAVASQYGVALSSDARDAVVKALSLPPAAPEAALIEAALVRFLRSEENVVELPEGPGDPAQTTAAALAALGPNPSNEALRAALLQALQRPAGDELVEDLSSSIKKPLAEIWGRQGALSRASAMLAGAKIAVPDGPRGQRFVTEVASALLDLNGTQVLLPAQGQGAAAGAMHVRVTGLPVLHQGLAASVDANQLKSLGFALGIVLVILVLLYRSFWSGLLGTFPAVLTLVVVYGGMGLFGVHLDIGTSMLASLVIGAGVDYGVHLMAEWYAPGDKPVADAAAYGASQTGLSIWINAIMVCAGFYVLTLGEARPLQNVGGLTAAAMLAAAVATFLTIPALARKRRYTAITKEVNTAVNAPSHRPDAVVQGTG